MDVKVVEQSILPYLTESSRIWVGYSGGLDSTALLHLVASLKLPHPVCALHVNHQISANANHWQQHCEDFAAALNIPCLVARVQVTNTGKGIENAAREARYRIFAEHIQKHDLLLLAQHRDDLAETFLFRLLRGTGIKGMQATPKSRAFEQGTLLRPLLQISRVEIERYAKSHTLEFVEDESNTDTAYARNFLRHAIFPQLQTRWPKYAEAFANTIDWVGEANQLLDEYAQQDLLSCDYRTERLGTSMAIKGLTTFSEKRIKHLIRHWISLHGFSLPHAVQLRQIQQIMAAKQDSTPILQWGDGEIRRYQQRLYLSRQLADCAHYSYEWNSAEPLPLPDGSVLQQQNDSPPADYTVSNRRGGERTRPLQRAASQTLKKLLQEYQLEPWLRDRIPLVYRQGELIAVGDLFVAANPHRQALSTAVFCWRYPTK